MQTVKNWCDEERVKKFGIWMASKQALNQRGTRALFNALAYSLRNILFNYRSYLNFYINIIYFIMIYFIIRDILIMIYLFYNLHNFFNKTNRQTRWRYSFRDGGSTWSRRRNDNPIEPSMHSCKVVFGTASWH
jgi:cellulose synthase/poly-beta-1,6-N-acetylglucosamine synthase-like glycosyltransferase